MTGDAAAAGTTVFVTLGTDHHPFQRLLSWLATWDAPDGVGFVVQHGRSPVPDALRERADVRLVDFLSRPDLEAALAGAGVVVSQGGPGGVMDTRRTGRLPVVVPRLAALGEVVDDHQVAFCRHLDRLGLARAAETEAALHAALDRAVADPDWVTCPPAVGDVEPDVLARFGAAVDRAVARPRGLRGRLPSLRRG